MFLVRAAAIGSRGKWLLWLSKENDDRARSSENRAVPRVCIALVQRKVFLYLCVSET